MKKKTFIVIWMLFIIFINSSMLIVSMVTLREAGAEKADVLIAATSRDELNLLTCLTGKKLGTAHAIARVRNPEYSDQLVAMREELGLSLTVNPEQAAAEDSKARIFTAPPPRW